MLKKTASPEAYLTNAQVLVVSPQPWDSIHVSKHHYTKEIARLAQRVYFLEPPSTERQKLSISPIPDWPNIFQVRYGRVAPAWVRFKVRWLYERLVNRMVQKIRRELGTSDLVWCFETNLYPNLRAFGGAKTLYHVVDPIPYQRQVRVGDQADAIVSVSPRILSRFEKTIPEDRKMVVNHGLASVFLSTETVSSEAPLKFGYFGNLTRPQIDHTAIVQIIDSHPEVEFHFWGPYENPRANSPEERFIRQLLSVKNVILHGQVSTQTLAHEIRRMDGFLLAYNADGLETDNSNSHKILEYLSTGKVVISKPIEFYSDTQLLETSKDDSSKALVAKFNEVATHIDRFNREATIGQRKAYAARNTYADQLQRILELLMQASE